MAIFRRMQLSDFYPIVVTPRHKECRDFYLRWFQAEIIFEASWFTMLHLPGATGHRIAFMAPDHPSTPPGAEVFSGHGLFLTFQVEDAAAVFKQLQRDGAPIAYELRTEDWGQTRFAMRDPAGTWLDIVQQVDPKPGFWDPYMQG